jgi:hypothetical protein
MGLTVVATMQAAIPHHAPVQAETPIRRLVTIPRRLGAIQLRGPTPLRRVAVTRRPEAILVRRGVPLLPAEAEIVAGVAAVAKAREGIAQGDVPKEDSPCAIKAVDLHDTTAALRTTAPLW